ncbi:hypothetical protein CR513_13925, partial [Mucuna pruriens]
MSQLQSASSGNLPSQTIPNPKGGNTSVVTLRGGRELPQQPAPQHLPRLADVESKLEVDSPTQQQARPVPLPFPTRTPPTRKFEMNEDLLKMFRKVEINISLLYAIKQVPKYAKFFKELCIHKRKKIKGGAETGGVVSGLIYGDPEIFSVPCTIGKCTFADAMLDLKASINIMPALVYKSLNFRDLEPTRMTIQLANRSVIQPLGILEDVLVQVNDLIFLADFYVLDMEGETSRKGSTLILGRPFLMTVKTKIDVYAKTLSMEFKDNLVQFNIFEAMQHPTEDHSLFGIDVIDKLVEEHTQLDVDSDEMPSFIEIINVLDCAASVAKAADSVEMSEVSNLFDSGEVIKIKTLLDHLKHAYLDDNQQFLVIIANNLHQEQQQRRLNSTILEIVKKEVRKLLAVGIIYPIPDNN